MPARRAKRATTRAARWRARRPPSLASSSGPLVRPARVFSDRVGGPRGEGDQPPAAAFGGDGEDLVAAVGAELVDVGGQGLVHPQPGQQQQAGEGVIAGAGGLGGVEEPDGLGAVQAEGGRGVVGWGPLDVGERVDRQDAFGDRVPVEAGQDGEAADLQRG